MLTLRASQPPVAHSKDRRIYESAYALPRTSAQSSPSSSGSSTASISAQLTSGSQRDPSLLRLEIKQRHSREQTGKNSPKPCLVCWSKTCKLKSHQNYVSYQERKRSTSPRKAMVQPPEVQFDLPIGNGRLDPFTALPVEGPSKESLRLFHDFFTRQSSLVYEKPRRLAFDSTYVPVLLRQAYSDSATCHSCLAMAATYAAVHGQNLRAPDEKLSAVYEAALRALRAQLIREKAKPRSTTVMAAVNLIMAQAIGMCDKGALSAHRTGIQGFVNAWGGIHNLEPQLVALIVWTDYWATLFTGLPPLYTYLLSRLEIKLENPPPQICGSAFEQPRMRQIASQMLLENCRITCRLVELVEDKITNSSTPARWQYFTYKRDCMATRNAVVHTKLFRTGSKAECLSLAMNMILTLTLRMVPWKSPSIELCEQMQTALTATGAAIEFWQSDTDLLIFVLFITSASGTYWDDKSWVLNLLQRTLERKYGFVQADWPSDWAKRELYSLKRFVWSDVLMEAYFKTTCRELNWLRHCDLESDIDEGYDLADDEDSG